jgi:hypothetical protein
MDETGRCFVAIPSQLILDYVIRRVQAKWEGLKLNVTQQLLVYADDVNTVSELIYNIKKKTEPLLVARTEFSPEVNAEKTKYMVMTPD